MATGTDAYLASNVSATTAAFPLKGGRYVMNVTATFGGGTVKLEMLAGDGASWVTPMNIAGNANSFTAAGSQALDLPAGQYRVNVATATAVYAVIARVLP
jgi:hypothetical protein